MQNKTKIRMVRMLKLSGVYFLVFFFGSLEIVALISANPTSITNLPHQHTSECSASVSFAPIVPKNSESILTALKLNGLTIFSNLLLKTGLDDILSKSGPFTVFAPSNDAFGSEDALNFTADKVLLKEVLSYHVIESALPLTEINNDVTPNTLSGDTLRINIYESKMTVNGALKIKMLIANNGVIYVIDKVLICEPSDIIQVLQRRKEFSILLTALQFTGLTASFQSKGPFTFLAPNNAAFKALPEGTIFSLFSKPDELKRVLQNHVLSGTVYSQGMNQSLELLSHREKARIVNAVIIEPDINAANGAIHVVSNVLPPFFDAIVVEAESSILNFDSNEMVINDEPILAVTTASVVVGPTTMMYT